MAKTNIKTIRANEVAQQNEEALKAARQAELDAIVEKDAFSTIPEVHTDGVHSEADEDDNLLGVSGGKYCTTLVGETIISAESKENLDAIKTRMENGVNGDGMLHKTVYILGMKCDIQGHNEEELAEDLRKAEEFAYAHKGHMFFDVTKAEDLDYSGYTENDGKQITVHDRTCFYIFDEKRIVNPEDYSTYVDVNDIKKELGLKDATIASMDKDEIEAQLVKILDSRFLKEDLEAAAAAAENDGDYDEGYDDGYDEGYDDGYDDGREEADY